MSLLLAAELPFTAPTFDFHAFAPEIILLGVLSVALLVDTFVDDAGAIVASLTSWGFLAALVPLVTMAWTGHEADVFGNGSYAVDNYALVLKAVFLISGYLVTLMSMNYIGEGDYWEGEYYLLLIASVLGMTVMASARDLISMFIALETLSIPAYMLAAWRKRDLKSDEAGMKYFLMGVFASAVMLYGMSLLYGITGTTVLADIAQGIGGSTSPAIVTMAVVFVLVGFAFKVSAVPFHQWAPDTYEGAPTPVTAFLAVASKTAGFVALITLVYVAFPTRSDVFQPLLWGIAAATMFVGNLIALRQTNIVRMLAYSGISHAGYMLAPLAIAGQDGTAAVVMPAVVAYLVIYMFMNLGAFAVVIAVARKTRSAEIDTWGGLRTYAPGLTFAMTIFLFALAGIPPLAGWYAKLEIFRALVAPGVASGYVLAVIVAVNSVIALAYYARVARAMWMEPVPDGDTTPIKVPSAVRSALVITAVATVVLGVFPGAVGHFSSSTTTCLTASAPANPADDC